MAFGFAMAGAGSASAASADTQSRPHHDRDFSVDLYERERRGDDVLVVRISSDEDHARARVEADFNRGRDDSERIRLNHRGDGTVRFDIPDRARSVHVEVTIDGKRHDIRCDETLYHLGGGGRR